MKYFIDERTGRVHIVPETPRTHEEVVESIRRRKVRKMQKAARKRNRRR